MSDIKLKVAKAYALVLEAEQLVMEAITADAREYGAPEPRDLQSPYGNLNDAARDLRWAMTERE